MAFHVHLIDLLWSVAPAANPQVGSNIEPATSPQARLCLEWYVGSTGSLRSRWTHAGD